MEDDGKLDGFLCPKNEQQVVTIPPSWMSLSNLERGSFPQKIDVEHMGTLKIKSCKLCAKDARSRGERTWAMQATQFFNDNREICDGA